MWVFKKKKQISDKVTPGMWLFDTGSSVNKPDSSFYYLASAPFFILFRNYPSFLNSAVKVTQSFKQQFRQIDVYVITAANEMCLFPLFTPA